MWHVLRHFHPFTIIKNLSDADIMLGSYLPWCPAIKEKGLSQKKLRYIYILEKQ